LNSAFIVIIRWRVGELAEVDGVGDSSNLKFCTKKNRQQKPKFVSELLAKKILFQGALRNYQMCIHHTTS